MSVNKFFYWSLKDVLFVVTLSLVFGFLYWILSQAWVFLSIAAGPFGIFMENIMLGLWLLAAPISIAIIRKPGAGIVAEILASLVEVIFFGVFFGPVLLITGLLQGLGSEIPFMFGCYKKFSWHYYVISGAFSAFIVFFHSAFIYGWYGSDLFWIRLVLQIISGIFLGGLLAKIIVDSLNKTGVVDNYAINIS